MKTDILKIGDKQLKSITDPVECFDKALSKTVDTMFSIMQSYQGAGLAAPQIGITKRIIVYGIEKNERYPDIDKIPFTVLINPVILNYSTEKDIYFEGCLSVPNIRGPVERSTTISGHAQDASGKIITFTKQGFAARVIQHELDHLNGILFLQRVADIAELVYSEN